MKVLAYHVVCRNNLTELCAEVNKFLEAGWELVSAATPDKNGDIMQTVVKLTEVPREPKATAWTTTFSKTPKGNLYSSIDETGDGGRDDDGT